MTTVIYHDGLMVSDSKVSDDDMAIAETPKIFRLENGGLLGLAGNARFTDLVEAFNSCLADHGEPPEIEDLFFAHEFDAIYVSPEGRIMLYDLEQENGEPYGGCCEVGSGIPSVIGSGGTLALAAWKAGAELIRAVEIAATIDNFTGGPIVALRLEKANAPA